MRTGFPPREAGVLQATHAFWQQKPQRAAPAQLGARGSGARVPRPGPRAPDLGGAAGLLCRHGPRRPHGADPGATDNGTGFLPFDDVSEELAATLDPRTLAARRIGEIKHRDSPGVAGGYVSNGCIECDALIGRFALEDLVHEHLAAGGTYAQLDIGIPLELPAATPAGLRIFG
jgi:hypothetical protein